jgi:hypothetical protein
MCTQWKHVGNGVTSPLILHLGKWAASRSGVSPLGGKNPQHQLNMCLWGPHSLAGHLGEGKDPCPCRELNNDSSAVQPVVVPVLAELSKHSISTLAFLSFLIIQLLTLINNKLTWITVYVGRCLRVDRVHFNVAAVSGSAFYVATWNAGRRAQCSKQEAKAFHREAFLLCC